MNSDLHYAVIEMVRAGVNYDAAMQAFERLFIIETLDKHKGNQFKAAAEMGMHRNTLRRKMAELAIPKPKTRAA
jgi:DNA-binding NtrC family response regulator